MEIYVCFSFLSSVYYFNNKSLFNSFLFLLNMNFITMKWVFWPWGKKIVVWIWICKEIILDPPTPGRGICSILHFSQDFLNSGNIFFINQKGIKGRYTTIQHLIIFMFITLHHENPTIIVLPKNYLFSKGIKMMMIYKTCWGTSELLLQLHYVWHLWMWV